MNHRYRFSDVLPWLCLVALFVTAGMLRPLLPIDETRYMSVAWEMWQHGGWLKPLSINGNPYHHKPPMLFWLINLVWSIFGVNRESALIVPLLACFGNIWLIGRIATYLFTDRDIDRTKIRMMMVASLPVMIYGTLMMFDMLLSFSVLLTILFLIRYLKLSQYRWQSVLGMGFGIGLGLLIKGPVILLHVLPVTLAAPYWNQGMTHKKRFYCDVLLSILIGAMMIIAWLVPVLSSSDNKFAFWLVWNQTAGRVTGNFSEAHVHPVWFYLPMIPVMLMPWLFIPGFWRDARALIVQKSVLKNDPAFRMLICWMVPVFIAFSLIKGKQPHYMIPLVPGIILLITGFMPSITVKQVRIALITVTALLIGGQIIADQKFFPRYDLMPIARMINSQQNYEWAFTPNYHGEFGFLARADKPLAEPDRKDLPEWLAAAPNRLAVMRFKEDDDIKGLQPVMIMPYRSGRIGVFSASK